MIVRLLVDIIGLWHERSPWNILSPVLGGPSSTDWRYYIRQLATGKTPITEFWKSQLQLIPDVLNMSNGIVICLPTSAGKTRLAEVAIANELSKQLLKKAVYVVPTRALASEIEQTLSLRLGPMNFGVVALYGGYDLSEFEETLLEQNRIVILTPEKLDLLIRRKQDFYEQICLVVVDEGHQVAEGPRGLRLEFILSRIRWHGQKYGTKFLFLSAVLPNGEELAQWLTGASETSRNISWKPTRIRQYGFFWGGDGRSNDGQLAFLEDFPKEIEPFIPGLVNRRSAPTRDEVLVRLAFHFAKVGPTMVFTISKRRVEEIVELLLSRVSSQKEGSVSSGQDVINSEILPFVSHILGKNHIMCRALQVGIAFHHGALPGGARRKIEEAIRNGLIPLFVANETLAAGVNLPVKSMIVDTVSRGATLMSIREFANVVGRAGRAGRETEANIIFLPDNEFNYPSYLPSFIESRVEPSESQILTTALEAAMPPDKEWMNQWWGEIRMRKRSGFLNPWTILVENCTLRIQQRMGEPAANDFRLHLRQALASRLRPTYSNVDWQGDKPIRRQIVMDAIRDSASKTDAFGSLLDVDTDDYKNLHGVIDSQIIALAMEEIFDPLNPESAASFVPFTLLGAHRITSDEMKHQYSRGLRNRFLKVARAVPQVDVRNKFNRTGLSLQGNLFLLSNVPTVKGLILEWKGDPSKWRDLLEGILKTIDQVPDLKPQRGLKRPLALMLSWLEGVSLVEIAAKYLDNDLGKATQITEHSISMLLPWGVNSLLELLTESDFNPREMSPLLRTLPGMLAFGVPDPYSAYAFALGLNDREIAQKAAVSYRSSVDEEKKDEFSFSEFVRWFSTLHENLEVIDGISNGDVVVAETVQRASELRSLGFRGKSKRSYIEIPEKYSDKFKSTEEVILFKDASQTGKWLVLDYLNRPRLECEITNHLENDLQKLDWIARWDPTPFGTRIEVTFIS